MVSLAVTGFLSGIITGMGLGGIILIPTLTVLLKFAQKTAQGINLVYFIPTAVIALVVHIKEKNIDFPLAVPLALSGVAGAVCGAVVVKYLPSPFLRTLFGCLLIITGIYRVVSAFSKK